MKKNKIPIFTVAQLGAFGLDYLLAEARKRTSQISDRRPLLAFAICGNRITVWPGHYGSKEEARAACQDLGAIYQLPARIGRGARPHTAARGVSIATSLASKRMTLPAT